MAAETTQIRERVRDVEYINIIRFRIERPVLAAAVRLHEITFALQLMPPFHRVEQNVLHFSFCLHPLYH